MNDLICYKCKHNQNDHGRANFIKISSECRINKCECIGFRPRAIPCEQCKLYFSGYDERCKMEQCCLDILEARAALEKAKKEIK